MNKQDLLTRLLATVVVASPIIACGGDGGGGGGPGGGTSLHPVHIISDNYNECLTKSAGANTVEVETCDWNNSEQEWLVTTSGANYSIQHSSGSCLTYTGAGQADNGTDGYPWELGACGASLAVTQNYGVGGNPPVPFDHWKWFIESAGTNSCLYVYSGFFGGLGQSAHGNCADDYFFGLGQVYMKWGFEDENDLNIDLGPAGAAANIY